MLTVWHSMAKSDIVLDDDEIDLQGRVRVKPDESGSEGIRIFPGRGNLRVGGDGTEGDLVLENVDGENRIHLDAGADNVSESSAAVYANESGYLHLGIDEEYGNGELQLSDDEGTSRVKITGGETFDPPDDSDSSTDWRQRAKHRSQQGPRMTEESREEAAEARREVFGELSHPNRVYLDGHRASLVLGGGGEGGEILLQDPNTDPNGGPKLRLSTKPEEDTRLSVQQTDGSTAMTLSEDGTLEVDTKLVVDGVELTKADLQKLKEL